MATEQIQPSGFRKFINWLFGGNLKQTSAEPGSVGFKQSGDVNNPLESFMNKYTAAGLTGAEREQNEWTAQREDTQAQRQVKDIIKAGLNPALMYESGAGGDYASASAGGVSGSGSLQELVSVMTLPLQLKQMAENIRNTRANTNNTDSDTDLKKAEQAKRIQEVDNLKQELNNLRSQQNLTDKQAAQIDKALEWADRLNEAIASEKENNSALALSTKKRIDTLLKGEKDIQIKTLAQMDAFIKKLRAEASKIAKEDNVLQLDIENYVLNHLSQGWLGSGLSIQNVIRGVIEAIKADNKKPLPEDFDFGFAE